MPPLIALTGATGFLGLHTCHALRHAGFRVRAVVRNPDRARATLLDPGWVDEVHAADLAHEDDLCRAFEGADVVIANAALGSWLGDDELYLRTNLEGTRNSMRAAARAGTGRVVHVSTVAVYRPRLGVRLAEDAPRRDQEPPRLDPTRLTTDIRYSRTKTLAEDAAREEAERAGMDLVLPRPGPIYGSHDTRFTTRLLRAVTRPVTIAPTVGVPLVHAGDVARAIVACCTVSAERGRAYNLAGEPVSLARVHTILRRLADRPARVLPLPVPAWAAFDCGRAERELGFSNRSLEEGLREVWENHPR